MSVNSINYKKNKMIFSKLIGEKYKIKKDPYDKSILIIQSNDKEIKCKCILFLIEKELNKSANNEKDIILSDSIIMWSDSNPYIDQYTREISKIIRDILRINNKYLLDQNNQLIVKNDLHDLIKNLIKNQYNFLDKTGKSINCNWVLSSNRQNGNEYYMITDIIYY
jgi:hypothetical protein